MVAARPAGAGSWSAPVAVSDPDLTSPFTPVAALDGAGDAVVTWEAAPAQGRPSSYTTKVQAVSRAAGGTFGAAVDLSAAAAVGQDGSSAGNPSVALDASGRATVVWWPYNDAAPKVEAVTHPVAGPWSAVGTIGTGGPQNSSPQPLVVADAAGDVAVSWRNPLDTTFFNGPGTARLSLRAAGSATWGTPVDVSTGGHAIGTGAIGVGLDASGAATAAWVDGTDHAVETATLAPGAGAASTPSTVGTGTSIFAPQLAKDPAGDATVAWYAEDATFKRETVVAAHRPSGGAWSTPATLSDADRFVNAFSLAAAPGDVAAVAFADTTRLNGTPFPPFTLRAARLDGGAWSAAADLTAEADGGSGPVVALSPTGDATTAWLARDGTSVTRLHVAGDDRTPPALAVSAPAAAVAGTAADFTATAPDADGGVSVAWSFGDGSGPASGTSVQHTYAAGGTYTITVTATDGAGNATTTTRTIAVTAPAPATTPPTDTTPTPPTPATSPTPPPAATVPAPKPSTPPAPKPATAASVITLPSATSCVSRRTLRITLHTPSGATIRKTTISVTGHKAKSYTGARAHAPITLTGLPKGKYTVTVTVTLSTKKTLKLVRRYKTCAAKRSVLRTSAA
jgi:PKD repeat protein